MPIDIHPQAAAEIDEADDWYMEVSPLVGANFREALFSALTRIENQPLSFPVVETPLRRCILRGFPYAIFFDDSAPRIRIIAVAHTRRKPGYWKTRVMG